MAMNSSKSLNLTLFWIILFYKVKGTNKKKAVKGKRKNKINTEEMPAAYRQPADMSATFGECANIFYSQLLLKITF